MKLLVATNNKNKLSEIKSLFADTSFEITSLAEEGINHEVIEDGKTFEENAIKKAKEYGELSGLLTLADDSGLEVDALDGRPGVYSARYAGEKATDKDNYTKLLDEMKNVSKEKRTARYKVVMALIDPSGFVKTFDGVLEGLITLEPKGENGFGYDPVFFIPQFNATSAEITQDQKNQVSHRAIAIRKVIQFLS